MYLYQVGTQSTVLVNQVSFLFIHSSHIKTVQYKCHIQSRYILSGKKIYECSSAVNCARFNFTNDHCQTSPTNAWYLRLSWESLQILGNILLHEGHELHTSPHDYNLLFNPPFNTACSDRQLSTKVVNFNWGLYCSQSVRKGFTAVAGLGGANAPPFGG